MTDKNKDDKLNTLLNLIQDTKMDMQDMRNDTKELRRE